MKPIPPFVLALTPVAAARAARTARGGATSAFSVPLRGLARRLGERRAAVLVGWRPTASGYRFGGWVLGSYTPVQGGVVSSESRNSAASAATPRLRTISKRSLLITTSSTSSTV